MCALTFGCRYLWAPLHLGTVTCGLCDIVAPEGRPEVTTNGTKGVQKRPPTTQRAPRSDQRRHNGRPEATADGTNGAGKRPPTAHGTPRNDHRRHKGRSRTTTDRTTCTRKRPPTPQRAPGSLPEACFRGKSCSRRGGNVVVEDGKAACSAPVTRGFGENRALAEAGTWFWDAAMPRAAPP